MGTALVSSRLMVRNAARMIDIDHKVKEKFLLLYHRINQCIQLWQKDMLLIHALILLMMLCKYMVGMAI